MNRTDDDAPAGLVPPKRRYLRVPALSVLCGMLTYPLFRLVGSGGMADFGYGAMAASVSYVLAIFLYFGIAGLAYRGAVTILSLGAIFGSAIAVAFGGIQNVWFVATSWGSVLVAGVVVGLMLRRGRGSLRTYVVGLAIITVLILAAFLPKWPALREAFAGSGDQVVKAFERDLVAGGRSETTAQQYADTLRWLMALFVRLMPGFTIVNGIIQFSLGFLWLASRVTKERPDVAAVRPFVFWKMPFAVMPALLVAIVARLVGPEAVKIVADNALFVLAIFYMVTGMAVVEYGLLRFRISLPLRILFYVALALTTINGALLLVLLGVLDSYWDWRKVAVQPK